MVANARGQSYINCGIVLTVLATCFVASRFVARWKSGVSLGLDDGMIVVSLLLAFSMLGEGVICEWSPASYLSMHGNVNNAIWDIHVKLKCESITQPLTGAIVDF
jgi:hypothetical protein